MKMPDFAGNSVLAKVRAMYGKRLDSKNYNELLACHSVTEAADYLKSKTDYAEIFGGIPTATLSRGQLESLLHNKLFNDFASIIRYQKASGNELYKYFIMKNDIQQMINLLSSMKTKSESYLFSFPVFYNERSGLDLYALAKVKTEEEFLENVKDTIYYDTLKDAVSKYRTTGDLTVVQAEFNNFLDKEFIKIVSGKRSKKIYSEEFSSVYCTCKDTELIKILYRMERFSVPDEITESVRHPYLTQFTDKELEALVHADSTDEILQILRKTCYKKIVTEIDGGNIFASAEKYRFNVLHKALVYSTDPNVIMFSYMNISETEIKNIIHIIEGIRYGMPRNEITPLLCGIPDNK